MGNLEVVFRTEAGRRATNEDAVLVRQFGEVYLLAVADGLGGHSAGEVASRMTLIEIEEFFKANPPVTLSSEMLEKAIEKANKEVYLLSKENPDYSGMGSTLVAVLVSGNKALIANIGDSRAYLINDDIKQITRDHSLVQDLIDKNSISKEEARVHPQKNIVTRVLGTTESIRVDFFDEQLDKGTLLLCSDGLVDGLTDADIREIVVNNKNEELDCSLLINKALEAEGKDNISVILGRIKGK